VLSAEVGHRPDGAGHARRVVADTSPALGRRGWVAACTRGRHGGVGPRHHHPAGRGAGALSTVDHPRRVAPAALRANRYAVTDVLSDLRGAQPGGESAVVASRLWQQAADLLLRAHGRWTGAGKALLREARGGRDAAHRATDAVLDLVGAPCSTGTAWAGRRSLPAEPRGEACRVLSRATPGGWRHRRAAHAPRARRRRMRRRPGGAARQGSGRGSPRPNGGDGR